MAQRFPISFTATDTRVWRDYSAASGALNVTVDTAAAAAPVDYWDTIVKTNRVELTGTAVEANSKVTVFDGATALGTATADAQRCMEGHIDRPTFDWPRDAFTATAADVAGHTPAAGVSKLDDPIVGGNSGPKGNGESQLVEPQDGYRYYLDASTVLSANAEHFRY